MNTLSINKLNEYPTISLEEQKMLKGGQEKKGKKKKDDDDTIDGGTFSPLVIYGKSKKPCPACLDFHKANNPVAGHNHQSTLSPLGILIFNTIPHSMGIYGHKGN